MTGAQPDSTPRPVAVHGSYNWELQANNSDDKSDENINRAMTTVKLKPQKATSRKDPPLKPLPVPRSSSLTTKSQPLDSDDNELIIEPPVKSETLSVQKLQSVLLITYPHLPN